MLAEKDSPISSNHEQWEKIFNALSHLLQQQQTQLESLAKERKLLANRIKTQYDQWVSDVGLLQRQISQMKAEVSEAQLGRVLEVAKSELFVGLKKRDSALYKLKLENTEDDLEDFKLMFEYLTHKLSEHSEKSGDKSNECEGDKRVDGDSNSTENSNEKEKRSKFLEGEVSRLKRACERLTSKNSSEVSAVISERNFVWNQLKEMQDKYTSALNDKNAEIEQANEKIDKLLNGMNQLESVNSEKDETIVKLKSHVAKLEADSDKSNKEISRLSKEVEYLRNSKGALLTPVLTRCKTESSSHSRGSKRSLRARKPFSTNESDGSHSSHMLKKESRGSRIRGSGASSVSETARLFSSRFKVPKLKGSSSLLSPNPKRLSCGGT